MADFGDDLYRENILDHYKSPRNRGELPDANASAEGQNPLCGDELQIDLSVQDGRIEQIRFSGQGCAISQASTSMLTELVEGKPIEEAAALERADILEMLGIPLSPIRLKCALLGLGVLKVALHRGFGTPLPPDWPGADEIDWS